MKKKIIIAVLVLTLAAGVSFAKESGFAIGGEYSIDVLGGIPGSTLLTFRLPSVPIMFGLGLQIGENNFNMALLMDWWLWHQHLVGIIDLYAGPGIFVTLPSSVFIGARIPIGFQIWPLGTSLLELFLEIAPSITFLAPTGINIPQFGVQAGAGFRFWF